MKFRVSEVSILVNAQNKQKAIHVPKLIGTRNGKKITMKNIIFD